MVAASAQTSDLDIRVPAEQTEGTRSQVLRWLKAVGDPVALHEPLLELETDKVTVEIAAPGSGVLQEILKEEQEEVGPGDLLGRIGGGVASCGVLAPPADSVSGAADSRGTRDELGMGDGGGAAESPDVADAPDVPGMTRASEAPRLPEVLGMPSAPRTDSVPDASKVHQMHCVPGAIPTESSNRRGGQDSAHLLSPAVRRLLNEHSLEPSSIAGTGQGGRITVQDVLTAASLHPPVQAPAPKAVEARASSFAGVSAPGVTAPNPSAPAASALAAPMLEPSVLDTSVQGTSPKIRRVPHSAVRKRIAEHMVRSLLKTAPHVTTVFEADMSAVLAHRVQHRDEFAAQGVPLTLTVYFLQAAVAAIRAVPEANSRWTDSALEIFESVHIGVATALEDELVVPVLRDVDSLSLLAIARGLDELTSRAREGRLVPADVRGGTFTISNHGVSGSLLAAPIVINQPQAAILGVGRLEKRVVVEEAHGTDVMVIRPRCYVTLTIDHRVMDGHRANRFLQAFVDHLAGPFASP